MSGKDSKHCFNTSIDNLRLNFTISKHNAHIRALQKVWLICWFVQYFRPHRNWIVFMMYRCKLYKFIRMHY